MSHGPWAIGTRVLVRGTYPGVVTGHRGPGLLVKLDRPFTGHKIVHAAPAQCQAEPLVRKHQKCGYCGRFLANFKGGVRVARRLICTAHSPCFKKAAEAAKKDKAHDEPA